MLDQLPTEIVQSIASQLPTVSSIIDFSLTNRKLHAQISGDNYATFRLFVKRNFPTIRTPPYWKEAACILTTRSRAWDRRAFIAKALDPPADQLNPLYYDRARGPSIGYAPVIDSYETYSGSQWRDKREVLAWGAAGRVMMRVTEQDWTRWHTHRVRNDHLPHNDILDVQLLRPHQKESRVGEELILRRATNELTKLAIKADQNEFQVRTLFDTEGLAAECMAVSPGPMPLVAACNQECIQLFNGNAMERLAKPLSSLTIQQNIVYRHRRRCAKFLDHERLAVGVQYIEGQSIAPINIYRVTPDGSSTFPERFLPSSSGCGSDKGQNRTNANAIVPLDDVSSLSARAGEVFLSGWSDGIVRLYDRRAPAHSSVDFRDSVDDGQISSLLPIGHERFLAGSVQNACLKTFDLRMPGGKAYSYLDAGSSRSTASCLGQETSPDEIPPSLRPGPVDEAVNRQLNIFLAIRVQCPMRLWQPLPNQQLTHLPRYRGAIYSLSAPSSASPSVYAGVENHVIELDFVSTDDVQRSRHNPSAFGLDLGRETKEQILNLSCYERPRAGHELTDTVLLRNQVSWNISRLDDGLTEEGWDERWRLAAWDRKRTVWRRINRT
jgi:WD40 repeat protein